MIEVVLTVVLLAIDPLALLILRVLDTTGLFARYSAIGHGLVFHVLHVRLPLVQPCGFLLRQRAGLNAPVDTSILIDLTLVDTGSRGGLRKSQQRGNECDGGDKATGGFHVQSPGSYLGLSISLMPD
jgi:hypothetical protein